MTKQRFKALDDLIYATSVFTLRGSQRPKDYKEIERNFVDAVNKFTRNKLTSRQIKALKLSAEG